MTCSVVKELMPNYIDGLTSEETSEDIKRHLADCKNCCAVYEYLRSSDRYDDVEKKKDMNLVKDLKAGIQKRKRRSGSSIYFRLNRMLGRTKKILQKVKESRRKSWRIFSTIYGNQNAEPQNELSKSQKDCCY